MLFYFIRCFASLLWDVQGCRLYWAGVMPYIGYCRGSLTYCGKGIRMGKRCYKILVRDVPCAWVSLFVYHCERCPNKEFFLVRIFPHSDWIWRDTEYLSVFSPNAGKSGREKTPYLNTFHAVTAGKADQLQLTFTCLKSTKEKLENSVKNV